MGNNIIILITIICFLLFFLNAFIRPKFLAPFLFIFHFIGGFLTKKYGSVIPGISFIGLANLLTISSFLAYFLVYRHLFYKVDHSFLKIIGGYITALVISSLFNWDIDSFFRLISCFGAIIAINYFFQIASITSKNFENGFIFFLKSFFVIFSILGWINIIMLGASYDMAREHFFNFFIFEFPHSFGIFCAAITPIFLNYIVEGRVNKGYYIVVMPIMGTAILFGGSRVGFIVYLISICIFFLIRLRSEKTISNKTAIITVIIISIIIFQKTPVYEQLKDVFAISANHYLSLIGKTPMNTFQSRLNTWSYMLYEIQRQDKILTGLGYRAWDLKYRDTGNRGVSSQSDYMTRFFDSGLIGLLGLLLYKFMIVYCLIIHWGKFNEINKECTAIGIGLFSIFLGGFSEAVDGYASTSWLVPVLFSFGVYYKITSSNKP